MNLGFCIIPDNQPAIAVQRLDDRIWIAIGDTTTILTDAEVQQLVAALNRSLATQR